MFAQMPELPKTGDIGSWFGWVVAVLFLLISGALGYLIAFNKKQESDNENMLNRLIKTLEDGQKAAQEYLKETWAEHDKDRTAFMHHQEKMAETLGKIQVNSDKNHHEITNELKGIKEALVRHNGSR